MTLRLILLVVAAVSTANAAVFQNPDDGPEDMHFPVVRALNNILSKNMDQLYTLLLMKMKYAKYFAIDEDKRLEMDKYIGYKADTLMKTIDYSGSRGLTPEIDDPQPYDMTECDEVYGCWKVNLKMEREMYKALQEGYSSAGNHEDADVQAKMVPQIQHCLGAINFHKGEIAKIDAVIVAKAAKQTAFEFSQKKQTIIGGDPAVLYPGSQ
ncbi:uncharacterized protein LOC135488356 [Lineus longissimus]|uniref:uncharacterized protein LOC135488356 n=1 Tax=Lineus longissimus TaxID=88925 RepID=UPI002B4EB469